MVPITVKVPSSLKKGRKLIVENFINFNILRPFFV